MFLQNYHIGQFDFDALTILIFFSVFLPLSSLFFSHSHTHMFRYLSFTNCLSTIYLTIQLFSLLFTFQPRISIHNKNIFIQKHVIKCPVLARKKNAPIGAWNETYLPYWKLWQTDQQTNRLTDRLGNREVSLLIHMLLFCDTSCCLLFRGNDLLLRKEL